MEYICCVICCWLTRYINYPGKYELYNNKKCLNLPMVIEKLVGNREINLIAKS
jgi:hypothetical protein